MSAPAPRIGADRVILVVFLFAAAVGAWIGVMYPLSPHASENALPRRD